jgi:anti-sigma regulatory factor (Ser/Thr protein kinase)
MAISMVRKSIGIANRIAELERIVAGVEDFGKESGLSQSLINDLNVALDEVLNNVISYGYSDSAEHLIQVELSFNGTEVAIVITDDGKPFDPLQAPPPNLDKLKTRAVGGVGIHFVRHLVDHCSYLRSREHNQLTLRKRVV